MLKKLRAFLCALLVVMSIMSISLTAFAVENNNNFPTGIPEYAERHELVVIIPSANEMTPRSVKTCPVDPKTVGPGVTTNLAVIAATAQNISFNVKGEVVSGNASGSTYSVNLQRSGASILSVTADVDGEFHKSPDANLNQSTHTFVLHNTTNATIKVTLIYYLW